MINPKTFRINNILPEINGEIIHCIPSDIGHHLIVYCSIFTFQFILRLRICNDCCWEFNSSSISHSKCNVRFIWLWFAWNIFSYILLRSLDDHLNIIALRLACQRVTFFSFSASYLSHQGHLYGTQPAQRFIRITFNQHIAF